MLATHYFRGYSVWNATKAFQMEKTLRLQHAFKRPQPGVFRRAPGIFSWVKRLGGHTLIEYILLGIWPICVFCNILEPKQKRKSRKFYSIPGHVIYVVVIYGWDYATCEWACTCALFINDWNSLTYTHLTIKCEVYEVFVNQRRVFRKVRFMCSLLQMYSYLCCFMNETRYLYPLVVTCLLSSYQ